MPLHIDTRLAQAGTHCDSINTGDTAPPIHMSSTYERAPDLTYPNGFIYARHNNPTRDLLEKNVADLENGSRAAAFGSGMAAVSGVIAGFPDAFIIYPDDTYHGVSSVLDEVFSKWGCEKSMVDMSDHSKLEEHLRKAFKSEKEYVLVWTETPSNPLLKVTDLKKVREMVDAMMKEYGSKGIIVVDSTWVTPWITKPIDFGAELVVHSLTKYFGGHSDLLAGLVVCGKSELAIEAFERVKNIQISMGAVCSPFDSWLVLRGLRSLGARMRMHCFNALKLAEFLEKHDKIEAVRYPGLNSHPEHQIASIQMNDKFGGMMSIQIKGGEESAIKFVAALKVFRRATSLGGTESLIEHRASIEDYSGPHSCPRNLCRISVGIEDLDDLIEDVEQALSSI